AGCGQPATTDDPRRGQPAGECVTGAGLVAWPASRAGRALEGWHLPGRCRPVCEQAGRAQPLDLVHAGTAGRTHRLKPPPTAPASNQTQADSCSRSAVSTTAPVATWARA